MRDHGHVDIVCNVATTSAATPMLELSEHAVDQTVLANVRGALFTYQTAGRATASHGSGTIVNVVDPTVGGAGVTGAAIVAISTELSCAAVHAAVVDSDAAGTVGVRLAAAGPDCSR